MLLFRIVFRFLVPTSLAVTRVFNGAFPNLISAKQISNRITFILERIEITIDGLWIFLVLGRCFSCCALYSSVAEGKDARRGRK